MGWDIFCINCRRDKLFEIKSKFIDNKFMRTMREYGKSFFYLGIEESDELYEFQWYNKTRRIRVSYLVSFEEDLKFKEVDCSS